jgi:hypothetical protein
MNKNEKKKLDELFDGQRILRHDYKSSPDPIIESKIEELDTGIRHIVYKETTKRGVEAIAGLVAGAVGYNMLANVSPETAEYIINLQAFLMVGGGAFCLKGIYGMIKMTNMLFKETYKNIRKNG